MGIVRPTGVVGLGKGGRNNKERVGKERDERQQGDDGRGGGDDADQLLHPRESMEERDWKMLRGGWGMDPRAKEEQDKVFTLRPPTNGEGGEQRRFDTEEDRGGEKEMHREGGRDGWMKDVVFFDSD